MATASGDYAKARAHAQLIFDGEKASTLYIQACEAEAEHLLLKYAHIVRRLANELLVKRTLDGTEIDLCIAEAVDRKLMEDEWDRRRQWKEIAAND